MLRGYSLRENYHKAGKTSEIVIYEKLKGFFPEHPRENLRGCDPLQQ